jgi:hypothetical protein
MVEPYIEGAIGKEPGTRESMLWDEDHMMESMARAAKEGFNIHTHSMGSYSTHRVIDCYENAQRLYPNPTLRNIIAHEEGAFEELEEITKADIKWLNRFTASVNKKRDPISRYERKARRYAAWKKVKVVLIALLLLIIALAVVVIAKQTV